MLCNDRNVIQNSTLYKNTKEKPKMQPKFVVSSSKNCQQQFSGIANIQLSFCISCACKGKQKNNNLEHDNISGNAEGNM